jgi:hypothetical protein
MRQVFPPQDGKILLGATALQVLLLPLHCVATYATYHCQLLLLLVCLVLLLAVPVAAADRW